MLLLFNILAYGLSNKLNIPFPGSIYEKKNYCTINWTPDNRN